MSAKSQALVIAGLVLMMIVIAGIIVTLAPLLNGIGTQAASSLNTTTEAGYANSTQALGETAETEAAVFAFLPWLAVGLAVLGLFLAKNKGLSI